MTEAHRPITVAPGAPHSGARQESTMAKRICLVALLILVALGGWSSRLDAPAMSQVTAGMELLSSWR